MRLNKTALFIPLLMIIFVVGLNMLGEKQERQFNQFTQLFEEAQALYNEGDYVESVSNLQKVSNLYEDNERIAYLSALNYINLDDDEQAIEQMIQALHYNPYFVENPLFMLHFTEILLAADKQQDAKVTLQHCQILIDQEVIKDEGYSSRINELTALLNEVNISEK